MNFLLTNCIPRRTLTFLMGWFSRIENPLICRTAIKVWGFFTDLDLADAAEQNFRSLHHCFTRTLKPGARPVDMTANVLVSPCDGIIGACGTITQGRLLQVKGSSYTLADLLADPAEAAAHDGGLYVTLRLTSAMYHHFHAPHDIHVAQVSHIQGDVFNVNPIALRRVPNLYCRNERAVIRAFLSATGDAITIVPVAAILVAGIRLRFLALPRGRGRTCHAADASLRKGEAMGWFEHGSTIIVLAPAGFRLAGTVRPSGRIAMGQPLMLRPD